ncbi:hypothetical protein MCAL160_0393 [Mycoplasmopsis californica HAZ160_1]|uniref:Uncharacterized protein n=1 Tax=Mycoplasmopsis californica HAZ160_1 TaxID=1397850 RepID=A0AAT9F7W5_9BACT|nr:hypothetical protein [Mycoplasmopsis californica]BAP00993.1 hypothetical protein MCAL160_0393 [Mycoplasmopsis californica HAZ160_1]BBG40858.1 hypothetical protein MCAL106_0393 [Mycoplasmopsis californica]BBG41452.1 hypothetical protein MCAL106E_0393 [Mycoplasmopsis californica]BBG42045.1 hypothetical protein MCAL106L_0393 [Mycoplasmopsis californica]BBG42628.1 hypothetical protein MCAL160E_0393 [Mycoplasmopsis californica]
MLILFNRRFSRQLHLATITVFKLFEFENVIKNQKAYDELKQSALETLKNEAKIEKFKQELATKVVKDNSFIKIIEAGEKSFETQDPLQNVINMLTVINGYTISLLPISKRYGRLEVDYLDDKYVYVNNGENIGSIYKPNIEKTNAEQKNLLFLEAVDETNYEEYLEAITYTTSALMTIFETETLRKIMSIVADNVDTESTAEIDWTTEGWDQFGEVSLIRKSRKGTPKCHI